MRNISAKIILKESTNNSSNSLDGQSNFALRIYPPQKFLDSKFNVLNISVFKNGTRIFSYSERSVRSRSESITPSNRYGFFDISLTTNQARELSSAAKKGVKGSYESFLIINPDKMAGEIYKLSIQETDQLIIGVPTVTVPSSTSVTREQDLPSRTEFTSTFTDDPDKFDQKISRNKNNMSLNDNNVSISYYLVDKNTVRVALTNLPAGYSRVEVLSKKSGQYNFNEQSIKKINETERGYMSNWFFSYNKVKEPGNKFNESGGYILFDLQIFADERNTIIERVNKVSQNYFRNARAQDGQLGNSPLTGLPLFPVPIVNSGEIAQIRIKMHSDTGRSKTYTVPLGISTMAYSDSKIIFDSSPTRLNSSNLTQQIERSLMTSNPINDSNRNLYIDTIGRNEYNQNDIIIDLNVNIIDQLGVDGSILDILNTTSPPDAPSSRIGGSFLVALVTRYDSFTGNTFDLGFTAKDKFIDRISSLANSLSLRNIIGSKTNGNLESILNISSNGLTLVYNFHFYEITPEMIGAFLSANSVEDATAAPLLSSIGSSRLSDSRDFNNFISNILRSRTPIQTANISFEYSTKIQEQVNIITSPLEKRQENTNIPYFEISGQITRSINHVAFFEVFRIEESSVINSISSDNINNINFKEIKIGTIDASLDRFLIKDFVPEDNIEGVNNSGREVSIKTYYKIVPYGYLLNNGLLTDSFRKLDTEIFVR